MTDPRNHLIKELAYASHKRKIKILKQLAQNTENKFDSNSIQFATRLILDLKPSDVDERICDIANSISQHYKDKGLHDKSLEYARKAVELASEISYKKGLITANLKLASANTVFGNYKEALDASFNALRLSEEINNKSSISQSLNNIGVINCHTNKYENSLTFFKRSLEIKRELHDEAGIINVYQNLSLVYNRLGKMEEALNYAKKVLQHHQSLNNQRGIAQAYNNMGIIYSGLGETNKAIEYFRNCLTIKKELGDDWRICNTLISIAECHKQNSQIEAAIHSYLQAQEYAIKVNATDLLSAIYQDLSELHYQKQDHQKAYEYLKKHIIEDKKIRNTETEKQITELRSKFEMEKKEKENEIYRLKNIELAKANATKDKFFSIISHDLRSPFASLKGYTNLLLKRIDEFSKDDIIKFTEDINKTIQSTNQLLENLLTWSRFNTDEMPFKPESLELHKIVQDISKSLSLNFKLKDLHFENWITKELSVFADQEMLKTILRNLISNAVKFTPEKGKIVINASKVGDYVEITVKDNGVGIDKDKIKRLFSLNNKQTTRGTNYEKGTGLGLILCKEFVEKNGGTINAESVVGKGSIFTMTIPAKR
ncbi:MAG: tetratricopeptide repeat-containing sensor histidine kinase [Candidatus Cloacimonetes bacterium]|nr:tetratricopeptide repeat-containing sensor histidine kinase [Candidatus Cloacimonadota bacterium]MCF7814100.1 tetratricopeptide repeat-containing sensor histidine kinase [Candidatus Cloacimonadota bacterium]MCF7867971.1 tetratricopeptide repeat-containing sensor histidine kinase [Candidatus Cloacimonadota bacterium]MCF7883429.1 tetratricopeptide repeat-containing sensor histidine kinase [Candidatus Cloacimonadota bacterium]